MTELREIRNDCWRNVTENETPYSKSPIMVNVTVNSHSEEEEKEEEKPKSESKGSKQLLTEG